MSLISTEKDMDIKEMLAARQAAVAAAKDAGAVPGAPTEADKNLPTPDLGNIAIGMASSAEAGASSGPQTSANDIPDAELDEAKAEAAVGVYKSTGLRRFVDKNGQWVEQQKGFFYLTREDHLEEIQVFVERGTVERVK